VLLHARRQRWGVAGQRVEECDSEEQQRCCGGWGAVNRRQEEEERQGSGQADVWELMGLCDAAMTVVDSISSGNTLPSGSRAKGLLNWLTCK
jgi:hypothetical protein